MIFIVTICTVLNMKTQRASEIINIVGDKELASFVNNVTKRT